MSGDQPTAQIPLAEAMRAANGLLEAGLIKDWALGGALAAHGLTEEAVREAERIDYEGVPAKVFRTEHIVAIAASVGRAKDKARIEQFSQQVDLDKVALEKILQRHNLNCRSHEARDATQTGPRILSGENPQSGPAHSTVQDLSPPRQTNRCPISLPTSLSK